MTACFSSSNIRYLRVEVLGVESRVLGGWSGAQEHGCEEREQGSRDRGRGGDGPDAVGEGGRSPMNNRLAEPNF
jgi:hypothetical protein